MASHLITSKFPAADLAQGHEICDDLTHASMDTEFLAATGKTRHLELLAERPNITTLWIADLGASHAEIIGKMKWLRTLCIRGTRAADLSPFANLAALVVLIIDGATRLEDLSFVSSLRNLRALYLRDIKKPLNIAPLAKLGGLQELTLSCGIWNGLELGNLEPLRQLKSLRFLTLAPQMKNASLEPLRELTQLEELILNNKFAMEEYARLSGYLPSVACPNFEEILEPFPHKACSRCQQHTLLIPLGAGSRMLCKSCDAQKIEALKNRFAEIAAEARQESTRKRS